MQPRIVSQEEWLTAREVLLAREKELTRARDALSAERQRLPMVKVEKEYVFDTPAGRRSLSDLFDGRSQLIVYHFMMGPDWAEGCPSCSLLADQFDGVLTHLRQRDATLTAVARAPLAKIQAFKQRMGWQFPWASSYGSEFNWDFHVSFRPEEVASGKMYYNYGINQFPSDEGPGLSVFFKDAAGTVFHTYSTFARGGNPLLGVYNFLDLTPKGRDEAGLPWPMAWVRHRDRYDGDSQPVASAAASCCEQEQI